MRREHNLLFKPPEACSGHRPVRMTRGVICNAVAKMFKEAIHMSSHAVSGQYKVQVSLCHGPAGTSLKEGWC